MELNDIIAIGVGIVAVAIAIVSWQRSGQPFTFQGVTEALESSRPLATELQEVAQVAVASSQQLKESGKINSNDEAFQHAVNHVERWYNAFAPDIELDPEVVANAVEGAYFWLRKGQGEAEPATGRFLLTGAEGMSITPPPSGVGLV